MRSRVAEEGRSKDWVRKCYAFRKKVEKDVIWCMQVWKKEE